MLEVSHPLKLQNKCICQLQYFHSHVPHNYTTCKRFGLWHYPPLKWSTSSFLGFLHLTRNSQHGLRDTVMTLSASLSSASLLGCHLLLMAVRLRSASSGSTWYGLRKLTWNTGWTFHQFGGLILYEALPTLWLELALHTCEWVFCLDFQGIWVILEIASPIPCRQP